MKTVKLYTNELEKIKINPVLDKYAGKILFPEKYAKGLATIERLKFTNKK